MSATTIGIICAASTLALLIKAAHDINKIIDEYIKEQP